MSIEDLIPDRVFLSPASKSLPAGEGYIDEDGYLRDGCDRGHAWLAFEKDPGKCNPEFVNINRLLSVLSEKLPSKMEEIHNKNNIGIVIADNWATPYSEGFGIGVAWAIKMIKGEANNENENHS